MGGLKPSASPVPAGPSRGTRQARTLFRRTLFRRQFYLQLLRIVAARTRSPSRQGRIFVSMMGSVGDLVYLFPSLEVLRRRYVIDMGTGGYPYLAVANNNPHLARIYAPFVYKPRRAAQRRLIERVLSPFYERVLLLDPPDGDWWKEGKHFVERYARACGCPPPAKGIFYLSDDNRRAAADFLRGRGLEAFVYVAQMVRHRLPFRSWPLGHYHALLQLLHERLGLPIVVDTVGSDETALPRFCLDAGRLDVLTAAAVIARARLFVGSDSGLTHVAAALGTPTAAIHLGYPPETCVALGDRVAVVRQRRPFDDPAATSPEEVLAVVESLLPERSRR
jgi:ADP-heptose:LPS heptosyltransferase